MRRITFLQELLSVQLVRLHGKIIYRLERKRVQIEVDEEYRIDNGVQGKEVNLLRSLGEMEHVLHPVRGAMARIGRDPLSREGGVVKLRGGQGGLARGERVLRSLFRRKMKVKRSEIYGYVSYVCLLVIETGDTDQC